MLRGKRAVCVLFSLGTSRRETGSNNTNKNSNTNNSRVSSSRFRPCLELVCFPPFFSPNQSWQTKSLALHYGISVGPQMKDQLRLKTSEIEMSATILSGFYDIDMLYKDKSLNMNALHLNSMLDKKAVGAPVTASALANNCTYAQGFLRRNSASNVDCTNNGNKYSATCYSNMKESSASTAIMNKENKFRERAYSETGERSQQLQALQQKPGSQINSTRYKTELCRPFEENGACKYGEKCQFAHGYHELRSLSRHPKYKTEPCRTFHTIGFCPYGPRCHFIHNAEERRPAPANANTSVPPELKASRDPIQQQAAVAAFRDRPKLHHSLSFSGFSTQHGLDSPLTESPTSRTPPPASSSDSCRSSGPFFEDVLAPSANGAFSSFATAQDLKALLAPLAVHAHGGYQSNPAYYSNFQTAMGPPSPPYSSLGHLQALQRLSESPVFDSPPSPYDSMSDRDSYASGSSGSLSGSESPSLEAGRRLPIFSRLSISDD
ncbi:mRNA decay activator protein ZFP36L2 [Ictalurus punctatus]|uniref:mRNA decay activator protein ZFP36 n=1 Tax=Ictalurus punctatus TaxID=7998 RepID=A0A2D0QMR8_ICTPU|nr:mRNA decay activator protein ZFP36L2 [Ictalurus punctatus]